MVSHQGPSSRKRLSPWLLGAPSAVSSFRVCSAAKSHLAQGHDPGQPPPMTHQCRGLKVSQLCPTENTPSAGPPCGSCHRVPLPCASLLSLPQLGAQGQPPENVPSGCTLSPSDAASQRTQRGMCPALETNSSRLSQCAREASCLGASASLITGGWNAGLFFFFFLFTGID